MSRIRSIHTDDAPAAIGPYSQAIEAGGYLFSAGQIALVPGTGEMVQGGVEAQARQVFSNLAGVLGAANLGFRDVVKTTVYLADMSDFATVNAVYGEHFAEPYPARSTVAAAGLPKGALVEIDVIARIA
jgi:2-iminobutanoate/2-iminopropanoate deaminase